MDVCARKFCVTKTPRTMFSFVVEFDVFFPCAFFSLCQHKTKRESKAMHTTATATADNNNNKNDDDHILSGNSGDQVHTHSDGDDHSEDDNDNGDDGRDQLDDDVAVMVDKTSTVLDLAHHPHEKIGGGYPLGEHLVELDLTNCRLRKIENLSHLKNLEVCAGCTCS